MIFTIKEYEPVIGALIGLARATDGNEHLISASSTALVRTILLACRDHSGDPTDLIHSIDGEKEKMVPNCFLCKNPCGRTASYDLSRLLFAGKEIQILKEAILSAVTDLAASDLPEEKEVLLYRGLTVIGLEDYSADQLKTFLNTLA